jgi:ribosomal protein L11 methyltransferase
MTDAIQVLRLTPPGALADPLAGLLAELGATGVWHDGDTLAAYFPAAARRDEVDHALAAWADHLKACGVAVPDVDGMAPAWGEAERGDWVTAWRDHFRPLPVGRRLIVLPEWEPPEAAGDRVPLRIRPGEGFGTGGHPTTAACLERLEAFLDGLPDPGRASVLDVGTGSGVLALAAAKLGAGRVLALDNDPAAIRNARDNRALNGADRVRLVVGTTAAVRGPFDLVLANLLANLIVDLMPDLARLLAPDGRLVLSGLLSGQGDRVEAALAAQGLRAVEHVGRGMWLTLEAGRSRAAP